MKYDVCVLMLVMEYNISIVKWNKSLFLIEKNFRDRFKKKKMIRWKVMKFIMCFWKIGKKNIKSRTQFKKRKYVVVFVPEMRKESGVFQTCYKIHSSSYRYSLT